MSAHNLSLPVVVKGHLNIKDDLGNVLVDKDNAIHPQNMARIISRALANEPNYFVNRMAFGNGGTIVDAAFTVTYRTPNDGQSPDVATWDSRLYNETYSEIIDEGQTVLNPLLGTDPGSADLNTGIRAGGGAVPTSDPTSVPHVSGPGVRSQEIGLQSEVLITAVLNGDEPLGQFASDSNPPTEDTESSFVFDELGLYSGGGPAINTSGYQHIDVGNRTSTDDSGLLPGQGYSFDIVVDGGTPVVIPFTTPVTGGSGAGGQILYGDLCQAINTGDIDWGMSGVNPLPGGATMSITDNSGGLFLSIGGAQTYGFLRVQSSTSGLTSTVNLAGTNTDGLLAELNQPLGAVLIDPVAGTVAGLQNNPIEPTQERERLLAHLIFSPVLKAKNRTLTITYTLTISVARTPGVS
jgi:hypothetical protein